MSEEGHWQGLSNDVFYSACQQLLTFSWYNEMQRLRGVARTAGLHSGKQETRQIFFPECFRLPEYSLGLSFRDTRQVQIVALSG